MNKIKPAALGKGQAGVITDCNYQFKPNSKNCKKLSLRKAINTKCKDCIYDELAAGTWLQQVTLCSSPNCPLYEVRPQTKAKLPDNVLTYYQVTETGTSQALTHGYTTR